MLGVATTLSAGARLGTHRSWVEEPVMVTPFSFAVVVTRGSFAKRDFGASDDRRSRMRAS
jgi:hypothetical protein